MKNLWLRQFLPILLCFSALGFYHSLTRGKVQADELNLYIKSASQKKDSFARLPLLVAELKTNSCQSIGSEYQEHYNFNTQNYNISICRKGEEWFYYRESKSNPESALLIPAKIVFGGEVFKAVEGKVTYFVGTNSDGYYSSVMYGNNQMIFEPELPSNANSAVVKQEDSTRFNPGSTTESGFPSLDLTTNYWKVCTENRHDVHPYLNGWQKFIGKSLGTISDYASVEGHNVRYSNAETARALVETSDGLMVTLDIVDLTETVNGVCVKPITSF